jgi:hypothetical protein
MTEATAGAIVTGIYSSTAATQIGALEISDFISPFHYIATGLVDEMRKEFDLDDTWVDIEIHTDTPTEGVSLAERFAGRDVSAMYTALRRRGAEFGLEMNQVTRLSNSRPATAAMRRAQERG